MRPSGHIPSQLIKVKPTDFEKATNIRHAQLRERAAKASVRYEKVKRVVQEVAERRENARKERENEVMAEEDPSTEALPKRSDAKQNQSFSRDEDFANAAAQTNEKEAALDLELMIAEQRRMALLNEKSKAAALRTARAPQSQEEAERVCEDVRIAECALEEKLRMAAVRKEQILKRKINKGMVHKPIVDESTPSKTIRVRSGHIWLLMLRFTKS